MWIVKHALEDVNLVWWKGVGFNWFLGDTFCWLWWIKKRKILSCGPFGWVGYGGIKLRKGTLCKIQSGKRKREEDEWMSFECLIFM